MKAGLEEHKEVNMRTKIMLECSDEDFANITSILRTLEEASDNFDAITTTDRSGDTKFRLVKGKKLWRAK